MKKKTLYTLIFLLSLFSCSEENTPIIINLPTDGNPSGGGGNASNCVESIPPSIVPMFDLNATFPNWETSPYNLPYATGETYFVNQGNSSGFGHSGFWRYGYDFTMFIGTEVLAARGGVVVHANDGAVDGDPNNTNLITIKHEDDTVALYSHFTQNGVLVNVGDIVRQGDLIGLSGNTGNTGGLPHLHFSVHPCSNLPGLSTVADCPSIPVNFKNTESNPRGLGTWQCYTAN